MRTLLSIPFLLLFLSPFMGTAQWDVERRVSEIRTGTPYEEIDVENRSFFSFDDEVIALKKEDEELHFQCFDPEGLKEKARSMTELEDNKMVHEGTVKIGGELYFLYAWWDGDKEEERLFSRKLDRNSCELGPAKKIFSYGDHRMEGEQVNAGFLSVKTIDKFDFYTSLKEDEDAEGKLMARFRIEPDEVDNEDEEKYMIGLLVFNEDMELQWKGVHLMPYHEERMDELDYSVNDEGEVYMLAEVSEGEDPDERDAPCHYEVFKFSDGKADFEHANIDLGEKIESSPGRIVLQGAPDGGVIFAGFYSAKEGRPAKGTITSKVDPDGGASKVRMTRFPKDVVAGFEGEGYLDDVEKTGPSNPDVGLNNLNIRHVRVYENGDLLLVGEQYWLDIKTIDGVTHETYHYEDLVAVRVSPEGSVKWARKLPKEQEGPQPGRDLSTMLHSNDEVIRFLIFDNNDNLRMKPTDEPEKHESHVAGYLNAYQVGHAEGNVTKTEILDITNVKRKELHDYSFSRFVSTGSDSFLFEATDDDDQDLLIEVKF